MNWSHVILEVYCARKWSITKHKYVYEAISTNPLKTKKKLNPDYKPDYKTPRKPSYCKGNPQFICLERNCPFLGYVEADKKDYTALYKRYRK